ncbi:MAG: pantoate--beta-alanine ligase [Alphaproteobacteria bacterium]|nr:pantoate--beta-alanine ligase [Alphaproteobacteria bacterium]MBU0796271.1 pantoate--beta-alanine ligase [Alphaproteobacteria bacterium]MBU0887482.1 pantoate--beta-alanine ligase [Alphaproteobacteria bacterium]MBU1813309.1 pantoate--beta-alanine ligase [Alphaproteobacteria bacterium]MBU2089273.1 pantoate--beta-alanine ligase [Alphaproteobacteria bacterium]
MEIARSIAEFRALRATVPTLGLVPTMGFLHEGHLSLVRRARSECGAAAATIFVNPTQFAANEDFSSYPRALERDLDLLRAEGCAFAFVPSGPEVMYPAGFDTRIEIGGVTGMLEGAVRPGHFDGVATVVAKLLNITQPTRAYFGQKDAQQCVVVRKLVRDLDMPVEIVVCRTVRTEDGLAMSSRNAYLSPPERQAALVVIRALRAAEADFTAGQRDAGALRATMREVLSGEALAAIDYVSAAHPETLAELDEVGAEGALLSLAVRIGKTRLLDNLVLGL